MDGLREIGQHFQTHFEVGRPDSRTDPGMHVARFRAVCLEKSDTLGGKVHRTASPSAMQQDGLGVDGVDDRHREAVGMSNQGGLAGLQEEPVGITGFSRKKDAVGMDLDGVAHRTIPIHGTQGALDVRLVPCVPRGPVEACFEKHDAHRSDAKELLHENSARRSVRSSSIGSPATNSLSSVCKSSKASLGARP
ncbi:MAG: hypothetical protein RL318_1049 [Fibrobacterota bacterium]